MFDEVFERLIMRGITSSNTALLCVDCQYGFTEDQPDELPVKGTDEKWRKELDNLAKEFKASTFLVVASKDDHPEDHKSFNEWSPHCIKGTRGNELFISNYDKVFTKGTTKDTDSKSAFYEDFDSKSENGLNEELENNNIKNLVIVGLAAEVCVLSTVKTAIEKGYKVYLVDAFVKSINGKDNSEIFSGLNVNII
jgi:nicotinamidase/pyrazinamidase